MDDTEWLAERFERERPRLRAAAYRMLGSVAAADDAVQDAWLRLSRAEADQIDNLGGWLTTVVARECLHQLRSRRHRREEPLAPELVVTAGEPDPEQEALLADSVGLALQVVLEQLMPGERLAFVLHDLFDVPFGEIAGIVGRTPAATRQLASRARRRVHGAEVPAAEPDRHRQRKVVEAFYAAAYAADFDALVRVLDPEVVLHTDFGNIVRGAKAVAEQARAPQGGNLRSILVNGTMGALITIDGRPDAVMAFTVADDKIVRIDVIRDTERVGRVADALGA
jgi:RNA polymerase sigma-70 factor (ECF subfamily)